MSNKPDFYDQVADVFMASLAAELSGVTRAQFLERFKKMYPTVEAARVAYRELQERAEAMQKKAEEDAAARGMKVVGIGYRTDKK
jgi:hypothetical protein